ncbi:MAG: 2OG-Fe(II) oxygenase [Nanoarchaeales archaeon]|nr:2OG-Fe(II) oxygenase [Nanoarchaeales archaeon]
MLNEWLSQSTIKNLKSNTSKFKSSVPFNYISIDNFLGNEKFNELKKICLKQDFYVEDHDLYHFKRTIDYKNSKDKIIIDFCNFLKSKEVISFFEKLSGIKLDNTKIDVHSLRLESGDYLLCHDDDVQGRAIAFILNFSDFEEIDGGKLELFNSQNSKPTTVCTSITPKNNRFNMFKVTPGKSFHQIEEVMSDNQRNSISGWFYKK